MNINTKTISSMAVGEARCFLCGHKKDAQAQSYASRLGLKISTSRGWVVTNAGKPPEPCVVVERLA